MDLNRNQFFFAGVLVVLIGLQLRLVASYTLTPETTRILAKRADAMSTDSPPPLAFTASDATQILPNVRKVIRPPEWLGWCLISVGSVLILHSLSMRKPE